METAVSQQQNAVARFLFGLYFAVCNMTVKEEQTMKKMILMTANGMNLFEKDLEMLVQERDYRTIGQRLTEMEPQQASRWLARRMSSCALRWPARWSRTKRNKSVPAPNRRAGLGT